MPLNATKQWDPLYKNWVICETRGRRGTMTTKSRLMVDDFERFRSFFLWGEGGRGETLQPLKEHENVHFIN